MNKCQSCADEIGNTENYCERCIEKGLDKSFEGECDTNEEVRE